MVLGTVRRAGESTGAHTTPRLGSDGARASGAAGIADGTGGAGDRRAGSRSIRGIPVRADSRGAHRVGGGNRGHAIRLIIPFSVRPMNTSSRFVLGRALLVAALVVGCKESTGPAGPRGATTLTVQSGDEQHALAGSAVALPLKVLVTDDEGDPVSDVLVSFAVKTGGGTITGGAARTDDAGVATAGVWTLGAFLGEHTVEASVSGLESLTFTANARC